MDKINEKKICFIICSNNEEYLDECLRYIDKLIIPEDYEVDLLTVGDAKSMAEGYEEARQSTDAKYKIYLHQDTYIINKYLIFDLLKIFEKDRRIASIGVRGSKNILGNTFSKRSEIYGEVVSLNNPEKLYSSKRYHINIPKNEIKGDYIEVGNIFGCFIATQTDIEWDNLIENDWNYYSVVHSLEVKKRGLKIVVANQQTPWCIHNGNNEGLAFTGEILNKLKEKYNSYIDAEVFKRVLICSSEVRYGSLRTSLQRMGYSAEEYFEKVTTLKLEEEVTDRLERWICQNSYLCVFSYNFSPNVAEAANRIGIKYISRSWDSPLLSYVFEEAGYETAWKFTFDKHEIAELNKMELPHVIHMPLVTDAVSFNNMNISKEERIQYSHDVSFVGRMYFTDILRSYHQKYNDESVQVMKDILNNDLCDWNDRDKIRNKITKNMQDVFYTEFSKGPNDYYDREFFDIAFFRNIAHAERVKILNELAKRFKVDIYTKDDTSELVNVNIHEPVHSILVTPKIYKLSKINLNITTRNIRTGVPLRVFDIMGVGGFALTNYQEEISELFEEDKEIVCFRTLEELVEKTEYYLKNESLRQKIAINGYNKVKKDFSYEAGINRIFDICEIK